MELYEFSREICNRRVTPVEPQFTPPTDEDWRRLDGAEAVSRLIEAFGAARVARWVHNIAALRGDVLDRPADRCLADGAALEHHICVQCGRDNS